MNNTWIKELDCLDKDLTIKDLLRNKTFLITGATGVIGSYLLRYLIYLNNKYLLNMRFYVIVRNKDSFYSMFHTDSSINVIVQDVTLPMHEQFHIDYYILGATNAYPKAYDESPVEIMKTNLLGIINAFEHAKQYNQNSKVLFISSSEVYGQYDVNEEGVKENFQGCIDQMNPRSCYTESKRASETLCVSYAKEYGIKTVIARPGYIFGPGFQKKNNRADSDFFSHASSGSNIVLNSQGTQIRSYCYVGNAVNALLYIALKGENCNAYNIASRENISIRLFAEKIAQRASVGVLLNENGNTKGGSVFKCAILNSDKIQQLGFCNTFSIEEGIELTLQHLKG